MNINHWFTLLTFAGLAGLALFNYKATTAVIGSISDFQNSYVSTIQGPAPKG